MKRTEHHLHSLNVRICIVVIALALLCSLACPLRAQVSRTEPRAREAAAKKNYIIVPITTELQQLATPGSETRVCVLINQNVLLGDPNPFALDQSDICNELARWARRKNGSVYFLPVAWVAPEHDTRASLASRLSVATFEGMGRIAGFRKTYVGLVPPFKHDELAAYDHSGHPRSWISLVEGIEIDQREQRVEPKERPIGNEIVKAYPIRTRLSAVLCRAADCMVHIVPHRVELTLTQATECQDLVARFVSELDLKHRREVSINYTSLRYDGWAYNPDSGGVTFIPRTRLGSGPRIAPNVSKQLKLLLSPDFKKRLGFEQVLNVADWGLCIHRMIPPPL